MGQYDKYPVRNASGYVEYLTAEQIESLREMGESVDVLDDHPSKAPPIAKNPANQAYINESWAKLQAEKRQSRGRRRGGAGRAAAESIITGVTVISGMGAQPPADMPYQAADAYDQARSSLVANRDEYLDEQTRAANDRNGGSSRRR